MDETLLTPEETGAALRALSHGPLTPEQLATAIGIDSDDPDDVEMVVDGILEGFRGIELADGRLADRVQVMDQAWLTTRISQAEIQKDLIYVTPGLQSLARLAARSLPLTDGGRAVTTFTDGDLERSSQAFQFPEGTLADTVEGDLVALRLHVHPGAAHATVDVQAPAEDQMSDSAAVAAAINAQAERILQLNRGEGVRHIVGVDGAATEALVEDPGLLADPGPPLEELLADLGWTLNEHVMAKDEATVANDSLSRVILAVTIHSDEDATEEDVDDAFAFLDLRRTLHDDATTTPPPALVARAAKALADPMMTDLIVDHTAADRAAVAAAQAVLEEHPDSAGAVYVLASNAERIGDVVNQEAYLQRAVTLDGDFMPAVGDLAWLTRDRGDLALAQQLYRHAGMGEGHAVAQIRNLSRPERGGPSRNAPCPCGSGKKYKACCGAQPGGSLTRRAELLREKILDFLDRPHRNDRFAELAHLRFGADADSEASTASDTVLSDLAVFDMGVLEEFLERHGPLLPDDERDLAESWLNSRRKAWRVVKMTAGRLVLHAEGDEVVLAVPTYQPLLETGSLVLARILDAAGAPMLFNGLVPLGAHLPPTVERALAPGAPPEELARTLSTDPIRSLSNRDGEPAVTCVALYAMTESTWPALLSHPELEEVEEDELVRMSPPTGPMEERYLRGRLTRERHVNGDHDILRIETNGEARMDRLHVLVATADPGAILEREIRTPAWQSAEDQRRLGIPGVPTEPSADEREAIAEFVRAQEMAWCDESIPALGGLTPREALDHPIGRGQLLNLLSQMDASPGTFDPDRILEHLGLS